MPKHTDKIDQSDEHNSRGIELADRGWFDEAKREFEKAIELDPESAHAYDNLGTVHVEKGDLDNALAVYLKALSSDPESPATHHYLASFLAAHGVELAVQHYRRAIELDPEMVDAHLNLGMALADGGQLEEALNEVEIAHKQDPEDEMVEHELASCLIDLQRYPEAITHLKRIIKMHPEHIEAYVDLGISYTAQGFYAEAESILQKALQLDADDFASHYHMAALNVAWGRQEQALDHLELAKTGDAARLRSWLRDDHAFAALRNNERLLKLLA